MSGEREKYQDLSNLLELKIEQEEIIMKNIEIIAMNMASLIEKGVISEDNTINTFIGWRKRGYKIRKGAEHVAEFSIWMKNPKKKEDLTEEELKKYREFILTTAYWFSDDQVEPMTEEDKKKFRRGKRTAL